MDFGGDTPGPIGWTVAAIVNLAAFLLSGLLGFLFKLFGGLGPLHFPIL